MKVSPILLIMLLFAANAADVVAQADLEVSLVETENIYPTIAEAPDQSTWIVKFPTRDVLQANRRLTFRVSNASTKSLKIYGEVISDSFQPAGFLDERDENKHSWKFGEKKLSPAETAHLITQNPKILRPGESFEFVTSARLIEKRKFRRTVFFSFADCDVIETVHSKEFIY